MNIFRISIKKSLVAGAHLYGQSAADAFFTEYLVQSQAALGSAQLAIYASNIAQVESRLCPAFVRFDEAFTRLVTPGATPEEQGRAFSRVDLPNLSGQHPVAPDDGPAYPEVSATYARGAQMGRSGRLVLRHAVTATEWVRYTQHNLLPVRFGRPSHRDASSARAPSVGEQLLEAISDEGGVYIMPWADDESDPNIRRITNFVFTGLQVASKPKKRAGPKTKQKAAIRRAALEAVKNGTEFDAAAVLAAIKPTGCAKGPVAGLVYLLKAGPYYKIGKTINFDKRLSQIKLQPPHAVEVVHVIRAADHSRVESHWHRRFAALRLNGEWFDLSEAEVSEFKSVSEM